MGFPSNAPHRGEAQLSFFPDPTPVPGIPPDILDYRPDVFAATETETYMETFIRDTPWIQRTAQLYGRTVITPRLTAFYGDQEANLSRLDPTKKLLPWTPELLDIRNRIEPLAGFTFNAVLLNYYRDGNDSVAWHSDNDGVPGRNRVVASVSFGQPRKFDIRKTNDHANKLSITLASGSYLLMHGRFQEDWEHRVAKSTRAVGPRINLTFRQL